MLDRLTQSETMTADEYLAALTERDRLRSLYAKLAAQCDACVTLAAPGAAPIGLDSTGDPTFAVPFTLLGVPAISAPLNKLCRSDCKWPDFKVSTPRYLRLLHGLRRSLRRTKTADDRLRNLPFSESTALPRVHPARWRRGCLRSTTMMRGAEAEPTNANDLMTFLPGRAILSNSVRT